MKTLKVNQKVKIGKREYRVVSRNNHYHLYTEEYLNSIIFDDLGISNPKKWVSKIVGYQVIRAFPAVRSLEDLTKVVQELIKLSSTNTITLIQFREAIEKSKVCINWEERLIKEVGNKLLFENNVSVSDELIEEMYSVADSKQKEILDNLFPNYVDDIISAQDLGIGEVMEVVGNHEYKGAWVMRIDYINSRFVDLSNPVHCFGSSCGLKGRRIDIQISSTTHDGGTTRTIEY